MGLVGGVTNGGVGAPDGGVSVYRGGGDVEGLCMWVGR